MAKSRDAIDDFAEEAAVFQRWARHGTATGETAAHEALVRITRLYLAALLLRPARSDELAGQPGAKRVDDEEWQAVLMAGKRMPLDLYGEVLDPLAIPPEENSIGSLADDVADIYRDVVSGLREYEAGLRGRAIQEWAFGLRHHWGRHATGAIRALHCWLEANAPELLAPMQEGST